MAADEQREAKLAAIPAPCPARAAPAMSPCSVPPHRGEEGRRRRGRKGRGGEESPALEEGRGGGKESAAVEEGRRGFGVSRGGKGRKVRRRSWLPSLGGGREEETCCYVEPDAMKRKERGDERK